MAGFKKPCIKCGFKEECDGKIFEFNCPCLDCLVKVICIDCCDEASDWFRVARIKTGKFNYDDLLERREINGSRMQ